VIAAGHITWPGTVEAVPIVIVLSAYGALYVAGVRRLRGTTRAVPGWRLACFAAGMLVLLGALVSPLAGVSDELFWAHMVEHLMIGDLAALLLVLGLTGPLLAPVLRLPGMGALRVLSHPVVAFTLWAVNLYAWHLRVLHEGAVRSDDVHALQHMLFIALGMNMWLALLGPLPKPAWFGNAARLGYIVAVRLTAGVLGNVFVFGGGALYNVYRPGERAWGISPGGDQVAAGGIMMVEGSLVTIGLFCWLFLRAARQTDERQELIELAASHGVELDERRAGRAVAAGRGEDLRKRILAE
jgi:putative membrane protein